MGLSLVLCSYLIVGSLHRWLNSPLFLGRSPWSLPSEEGLWIAFRGRTWVCLLEEDIFLPPKGLDIPNLGTVSPLILDLGVLGRGSGDWTWTPDPTGEDGWASPNSPTRPWRTVQKYNHMITYYTPTSHNNKTEKTRLCNNQPCYATMNTVETTVLYES